MSWPSQMCPHWLLTKTISTWCQKSKFEPAEVSLQPKRSISHHFKKKVSLNSNTLMLIPTSWCKFQHVDATFQQVDANSNCWCNFKSPFQHLMHLPNVDATFQQLMHIPIVDAFSVAIPTSWCHIPTVDVNFSQFQHLMHLPNVDATFSLHPNNWWTFQLLMPFFYCCYATFQQVDAPSNCWCHFYYKTFQLLMHIFSPLTNFVWFSHKRKGPNWFLPPLNKDCQSWTCWCTFQQFDAIFILLLCHFPTSWCTFQLLMRILLCNITAVDAPVPTVDANFILLLKLLFSQTQPWDAQNH